MRPGIVVWHDAQTRAAIPRPSVASRELLLLLGGHDVPVDISRRSLLGDTLASVVAELAPMDRLDVVVSAEVVERPDERLRVGDVLSSGAIGPLAEEVRSAPGRLALVADHDDPAESMAERLRASLGHDAAAPVMGVVALGEAVDRLLDLRRRAFEGNLVPPARQQRARETLFDKALVRSRLALDWLVVHAVAAGLLRPLAENDDRSRFELGLVRDIAARHAGHTASIAWPEEEELFPYPRDRRLTILAHVVQSVADCGWADAAGYAARARREVGPDRSESALKLLGAAGRALAAVGDSDEASDVLATALEGWLQTDAAQATYALSELLRVEGIRGAHARVDELHAIARQLLPDIGPESRPYVVLAVGRALVQTGRSREGLAVLGSDDVGSHAPGHVKTAAQRWRANAARTVRSVVEEKHALQVLDALGESDQRLLAHLDGEALGVIETEACLDALLALPAEGQEVRRLLARLSPNVSTRAIAESPDVLRRFRAEYRY